MLCRFAARFLFYTASLIAPLSASAAIVIEPPSLPPGSQYRLIFVTSGVRSGVSSNINDYNTFVTNAANSVPELAALGTTWRAVASTATVAARDNTGTNPTVSAGVPIYRLDGTAVAMSNALFWQSGHLSAINTLETGATAVAPFQVWTETTIAGLASSGGLGTVDGTYRPGMLNQSGGGAWALALSDNSLGHTYRFYGMSDVLTIVPEPATFLVWGLVMGCIAAIRNRQRILVAL